MGMYMPLLIGVFWNMAENRLKLKINWNHFNGKTCQELVTKQGSEKQNLQYRRTEQSFKIK